MADGLAEPRQVDVSTVGGMAGVLGAFPRLARHFAFIVVAPDARLAQIIDAGPYKVAQDIAVVLGGLVVLPGIARKTLGLHHHTVGHPLVVALCLEYQVVVTHNVVLGSQGVVDVPVAVPGGQGRCHGAVLTVDAAYVLGHLMCRLDHFYLLALYHFVADAPAEDAGVQTVAQHHGIEVALPPGVYQGVVVVVVLLLTPSVEGFVYHQQTQLVAGAEEGFRGGIVRGAHGIESGFLQQSCLAVLGIVVGGGSQKAVVMVHTGAVQLQGLTVELEAMGGIVAKGADAVAYLHAVCARLFQLGFIEIGVVGRPQTGIGYLERALQGSAAPVGAYHLGAQLHMVDVGGRYLDAPVVDIGRGGGHQPHRAVDA